MHILPHYEFLIDSSIAWFYLITNTLRVFTYIPQIVAVWRSQDGARALSLFTWSSWMVAHLAAILYGVLLRDAFFTVISLINFAGCATVTGIAAHRRGLFERKQRMTAMAPVAEAPNAPDVAHAAFVETMAGAYLDAADAFETSEPWQRDAWQPNRRVRESYALGRS